MRPTARAPYFCAIELKFTDEVYDIPAALAFVLTRRAPCVPGADERCSLHNLLGRVRIHSGTYLTPPEQEIMPTELCAKILNCTR